MTESNDSLPILFKYLVSHPKPLDRTNINPDIDTFNNISPIKVFYKDELAMVFLYIKLGSHLVFQN